MNTRIKFSTKRIFALTLTTLLLNATNMHAENAQDQQDSRNITSNITTLGTANDVSGLNTVLGTLATAANLAIVDNIVDDILVDTAVIGTAVIGGIVATIGGVLGDPDDAIEGSGSISAALGGMAGATFATGTDSLEAISNNTTTVPLATLANQTTQGLVALATSTQAVDIQGVGFATGDNSLVAITADIAAMQTDVDAILVDTAAIGAPTVATLASTVALVLGDPTAETGATSISAALGNPAGASISDDIIAVQTDVTSILEDTGVIGTPAAGTIASNIGNATASTGQASIS